VTQHQCTATLLLEMHPQLLSAALQNGLTAGLTTPRKMICSSCDQAPVHCNVACNRMHAPLLCVALQNRFTAGLCCCKYAYEFPLCTGFTGHLTLTFAVHTVVQSTAPLLTANCISPVLIAAVQNRLIVGMIHRSHTYEGLLFIQCNGCSPSCSQLVL